MDEERLTSSFRYLFVSVSDSAYRTVGLKRGAPVWHVTPATAALLLQHLRLDPDLHHVFVMGTSKPTSGMTGSVVTSDSVDLWSYAEDGATRLFVRLEPLPLDAADVAAIRADGACAAGPMASRLMRLLLYHHLGTCYRVFLAASLQLTEAAQHT